MTHPHFPSATAIDTLNKVIRTRRSIKPAEFSAEPVPDDVINEMLENANWAPTHGMTQPWRFFVISGNARTQFGEYLSRLYVEITPADQVKSAKAEKLKNNALASSHMIIIGMKRQPSGRIPEIEEIEAVACAVQNLHLTATAHGVGGYWSSGKAICNDRLRDDLGLSAEDKVLGLFYVGMPAGDWPAGTRTAMADKVTRLSERFDVT